VAAQSRGRQLNEVKEKKKYFTAARFSYNRFSASKQLFAEFPYGGSIFFTKQNSID
jgi:hypothetical protein